MTSVLARLLLFLSAYSPLMLILAVLLIDRYWLVPVALCLISLVSVLAMFSIVHSFRSDAALPLQINGLQRRDDQVVSYLVSYIIPFLAVPFDGIQKGVGLAIFFLILGILHIRLNLIYVNPVLALAGYRLYEVTSEGGGTHSLITKQRVVLGDALSVVKVGEDLLFAKTL